MLVLDHLFLILFKHCLLEHVPAFLDVKVFPQFIFAFEQGFGHEGNYKTFRLIFIVIDIDTIDIIGEPLVGQDIFMCVQSFILIFSQQLTY